MQDRCIQRYPSLYGSHDRIQACMAELSSVSTSYRFMECWGPLLSIVPCLWECSGKHAAYIGNLENNLASLSSEMLKLKNLSQDVKNRVKESEEQRMKRTNQVSGWLESVEATEKEVGEILQSGAQEVENKCVGSCCPKNCRSSYKLGKEVLTKMIPQVVRLTEEGKFDVVADKLPPPPVDELPMDNVVVGFESKFQEVWQVVEDRDCPVIGLVGIGGVGKTTLLKQINNEFSKTSQGFDLIIWIVVSKPANIGRVQEAFRNKLNIAHHLWDNRSEGERAILIYNILKKKKFVVLLDDIWERLELSEVGIPQPSRDSLSKVVFTTRSRDVCLSMEAQKLMEVGCLPPDKAFSLFCSKVGEDVLKSHPEIRGLVEDVASECQGLPLALITIGQAMNGKTDAQEWKDAKRVLEKYMYTFSGMEDRVLSKLVFSYDYLSTPTLKKCFEYCSLYPEDHNIRKEELIKLWLAERLIDEYDTLLQGRQIIQKLMQASLLETGEQEETVKMHDVIRDMALWVACERGEKRNKYWVDVTSGNHGATSMANNAEKVSLWGPKTTVESLAWLSFCHNLVTLIIRDTKLEELHGEIFNSMKVLKILNLSGNEKLKKLPAEIGVVTNLEYLNTRGTEISILPVGVKQLKKLRILIIDPRTMIPKGVISSCQLLQIFEQSSGGNNWEPTYEDKAERISMERELLRELLGELEGLKYITYLHLRLTSTTTIQTLLDSPKLSSRTSQLVLRYIKESSPVVIDLGQGTLTNHMETLQVQYCQMTLINLGRPSLSNNLCEVMFWGCYKIRNLTSLVYAPNLCTLNVALCESMEELIGEDAEETMTNVGTSLFSRLTSLHLWRLHNLRSICPHAALPFPALKLMTVVSCYNLRKLPLDSNSALTTPPQLKIHGDKEYWWDGLQWDSQATKDAFTPKFVSLDL